MSVCAAFIHFTFWDRSIVRAFKSQSVFLFQHRNISQRIPNCKYQPKITIQYTIWYMPVCHKLEQCLVLMEMFYSNRCVNIIPQCTVVRSAKLKFSARWHTESRKKAVCRCTCFTHKIYQAYTWWLGHYGMSEIDLCSDLLTLAAQLQ